MFSILNIILMIYEHCSTYSNLFKFKLLIQSYLNYSFDNCFLISIQFDNSVKSVISIMHFFLYSNIKYSTMIYFSFSAFIFVSGSAPIFPFLPLILKELGFSSISVGWIFTAYPVIVIFARPICGTLADKYRCHRALLIIFLILHLIAGFGIQWIPSMPFTTTAELQCDRNLSLRICSERLNESLIENVIYINKIRKSVNNTITCKVNIILSFLLQILVKGNLF